MRVQKSNTKFSKNESFRITKHVRLGNFDLSTPDSKKKEKKERKKV